MKKTYISPAVELTVMIEEGHLCLNSNQKYRVGTNMEHTLDDTKFDGTDYTPGIGKVLKPSDGERNAKDNDLLFEEDEW